MKTKSILAVLVAGALSFTACTNKIDEKTLSEINQFSTDWTSLGEKASSWSTELSKTAATAKEFAASQTALMNNLSTSKDEAMKAKVSEMAGKASQDAARFESMENEWNTFKSTWDETTNKFTQWKEKAMKGEITPEGASQDLADFRAQLNDAQTKFDSWSTSYAEAKTSCEQNMATAETFNVPSTTKK